MRTREKFSCSQYFFLVPSFVTCDDDDTWTLTLPATETERWDRGDTERNVIKISQNLSPSPTVSSVTASVVWTTLHHVVKLYHISNLHYQLILRMCSLYWWVKQVSVFVKTAYNSAAGLFNRFNGRYKNESLTTRWSIMKAAIRLTPGQLRAVSLWSNCSKLYPRWPGRARQGPWLYGYINLKWRMLQTALNIYDAEFLLPDVQRKSWPTKTEIYADIVFIMRHYLIMYLHTMAWTWHLTRNCYPALSTRPLASLPRLLLSFNREEIISNFPKDKSD